MLIQILKLFGLDIPAKVAEIKTGIERRVELATHHVSEIAREAAVVAAFSALASLTGAMAIGVGLIALFLWVADAYGVYSGLGVVGGILALVTLVFLAFTIVKGKSLASSTHRLPPYEVATPDRADSELAAENAIAPMQPLTAPAAIAPAPTTSAADLVEPLAFFLSKVARYPTIGHPVLDSLVGNLRVTAEGSADEALDRAANVIRNGDRANLVIVLSGAALVGWLLGRQARQ
jgi:hypothetical protein